MSEPAPLTDGELFEDLTPGPLDHAIVGREIRIYAETGSTNDLAMTYGGHGTVYVADRQHGGRGRLGRTWHSAPGLGLWFTVALERYADGLTFAAALAVRDALRDRAESKIKWPNDVYINGRKVCGILTERRDDRVAVGIGLNVHHAESDFPEELRQTATSLSRECPGPWRRGAVLAAVLTALDGYVAALYGDAFDRVRDEWAAACNVEGRTVNWEGSVGRAEEIDAAGALVIRFNGDSRKVVSGTVEFLD